MLQGNPCGIFEKFSKKVFSLVASVILLVIFPGIPLTILPGIYQGILPVFPQIVLPGIFLVIPLELYQDFSEAFLHKFSMEFLIKFPRHIPRISFKNFFGNFSTKFSKLSPWNFPSLSANIRMIYFNWFYHETSSGFTQELLPLIPRISSRTISEIFGSISTDGKYKIEVRFLYAPKHSAFLID